MMWEELLSRLLDIIQHDEVMAALYGGSIRAAGPSEITVPLLEWTLISDTEQELWNPIIFQFDQWLPTADEARHSELRLRQLFHRDMPITFDQVQFFSQYVDGDVLANPNRDDFAGRALRFRFTPLRRQYAFQE